MTTPPAHLPESVDVAIVGAGTAGATAAIHCARAGLRVVCLERAELSCAGARWVNGVVAASFEEAGVPAPVGDELVAPGSRFHLIAGTSSRRLTVTEHGLIEVDMRLLVGRLQEQALESGAALFGNVEVRELAGNVLHTNAGAVVADRVIDAAGLTGPNLLGSPAVQRADLCTAAQEVRRITDPAKARDFFARQQALLGDVVCFTGIAGGYSIINVRCHGDRVGILTGTIPAPGRASGTQLLQELCAQEDWIGEKIFGGARAIPIRRPYDRLALDRVAAIGDSACQVFPAHGSGVGAGMVAARYLAETVIADRPLHDYAVRWQREKGGLFASYDLLRRASERLSVEDLEQMMISGLLNAELARAGMEQRLPSMHPAQAAVLAIGAATRPLLAARLGAALPKLLAARALYRRYPHSPFELTTWSRRIAAIFGDAPDLG